MQRLIIRITAAILLIFQSVQAQVPQAGALDTTFNFGWPESDFTENTPGTGTAGIVYTIAQQPDGKILIGGSISGHNGMSQSNIIRLFSNGKRDTSFSSGMGPTNPNNKVNCIAIQPDGKIIIGGTFTNYQGTSRNRIARLLTNGSLDTSFTPGLGANGEVNTIALQSDGKILIGGAFTSYNGILRNRIARLNADGNIDTAFNPGTGANGTIICIALQADNKLIIGGSFTSFNNVASSRLARLYFDGNIDSSFNIGLGPNGEIRAISIQPDHKIFIGGAFSTYNGLAQRGIAKIAMNGSLEATFNIPPSLQMNVNSLAVDVDNKILIVGESSSFNGQPFRSISRLNSSGDLDSSFAHGTQITAPVYALLLQSDNKVLIGGVFLASVSNLHRAFTRLDTFGIRDPMFNPSMGPNSTVRTIALQPDGKLLVGGSFSRFDDEQRNRLARLLSNGSLDTSFIVGPGANTDVHTIVIQPDSKIIIAGAFDSYNQVSRVRIARLNINGSLDTTFHPGAGANGPIWAAVLQPDGKIIVGGNFSSFAGALVNNIVRLNSNGSVDVSFNTGQGASGVVNTLAIQPDGKVLLGGAFVGFNGAPINRIVRLNPNGSLDTTFNTGTGASNTISALSLQPDGKIVIGGEFASYDGISRNGIARLNANGSIDITFNPGTGVFGRVNTIALQPDGKVLLAGNIGSVNGINRVRIARLNTYGSLDLSFDPNAGPNGELNYVTLQPDGKLIIGGYFFRYNHLFRQHIARINSSNCTSTVTNITPTASICVGSSKNLIGTPGGTWVIASGPGSISGNVYTASAGAGTVSIYTLVNNCTSPLVTFEVELPTPPTMPDSIASCLGHTITLTPSGGGVNYRFYADSTGGSPLAGGDGVITFTTPILSNTTTYYISSLSDSGCESSTRTAVTVTVDLPNPPAVAAQLDICAGDSATITPTAGGVAYRIYVDSIGGSPITGGDSVTSFTTPIISTTTTYFIASLSAAGCESSSRTAVTVVVNPIPVVTIVQLADSLKADLGAGTYQWFRNGSTITGANSGHYIPLQSGLYTLRFTSLQGCTGLSNEINVIIAGVSNEAKQTLQWSAYPVPFNEQLTIEAPFPFSYQVLDARGAVRYEGRTENTELVIPSNDLVSGMYLVKIVVNGQAYTRKVVRK